MTVILGLIAFVLGLFAVLLVSTCSLPMFVSAPFVLISNFAAGSWSTALVGLAVVAAGIISVCYSDDYPCPLPQLLGAFGIALLLTVVDLFVSQYDFPDVIPLAPMILVLFTTVLFPMVSLVAAVVALPMRLLGVRSRALSSHFTMFGIAMVLDGLVSLLGVESFMDLDMFGSYGYLFTIHSRVGWDVMNTLQAYAEIDVGMRLLLGVAATLVFGYIQLRNEGVLDGPAARRRAAYRRAHTQPVRPAPRPAYRTTTDRPAYAAPAHSPEPSPAVRMSAADMAYLNALSEQVEGGMPVGIDTATGTTVVSRRR